jgi:hypothetical protein
MKMQGSGLSWASDVNDRDNIEPPERDGTDGKHKPSCDNEQGSPFSLDFGVKFVDRREYP